MMHIAADAHELWLNVLMVKRCEAMGRLMQGCRKCTSQHKLRRLQLSLYGKHAAARVSTPDPERDCVKHVATQAPRLQKLSFTSELGGTGRWRKLQLLKAANAELAHLEL